MEEKRGGGGGGGMTLPPMPSSGDEDGHLTKKLFNTPVGGGGVLTGTLVIGVLRHTGNRKLDHVPGCRHVRL